MAAATRSQRVKPVITAVDTKDITEPSRRSPSTSMTAAMRTASVATAPGSQDRGRSCRSPAVSSTHDWLVVRFMHDPVGGLIEWRPDARRRGGRSMRMGSRGGNAARVILGGGAPPRPAAPDQSRMAGGDRHLTELFPEAGLREITEVALPVAVEQATFAA